MSSTNSHAFSWPIRVYYEDTDHGGVVYYANYLKFMERARTEWLRSFGIELDRLGAEQELIFAVRRAEVDYLLPARFNDALQVTVALLRVGGASLELIQHIYLGEQCLCAGRIKLAAIHPQTLGPQRLTKHLLALLKPLVQEQT